MANCITGFRILCSLILVFVRPFSPSFYGLYLAAGFSDMIDGTIARRTHTESDFGAKLDGIADLVFILVCLARLMPILRPAPWLWIWIGIIALIKLTNLICVRGKAGFLHTLPNRLTGLILFLLPLTLHLIDFRYSAIIVCMTASFAAIHEGDIVRNTK